MAPAAHVVGVATAAAALLLLQLAASSAYPSAAHLDTVLGRKGGGGSGIVDEAAPAENARPRAADKSFVIFDAGSKGTRVHVFRFNKTTMDLLEINGSHELEFVDEVEPGLSSYAQPPLRPQDAQEPTLKLLRSAEKNVPASHMKTTPLMLGATAGLRLMAPKDRDNILEVVKNLFLNNSKLEFKPEWVRVIKGSEEGSYLWVAINYLLDKLGEDYSQTVAVVDMGGASVQMAYAISEKTANEDAPHVHKGEDPYVTKERLKGKYYRIYAHSYLHYGALAARVEILKAKNGSFSNCMLRGFSDSYSYNGRTYDATATPEGASYVKCREEIRKALNLSAPCEAKNCSFNGVWNGGGGAGQNNLYVISNFYKLATKVGIIDIDDASSAKVTPAKFREFAEKVCPLSVDEAKLEYINVTEVPYLCMDLAYQYTLLVDGFGLEPTKNITVAKKVKHGQYKVKAAWALGMAIEALATQKRRQDA